MLKLNLSSLCPSVSHPGDEPHVKQQGERAAMNQTNEHSLKYRYKDKMKTCQLKSQQIFSGQTDLELTVAAQMGLHKYLLPR